MSVYPPQTPDAAAAVALPAVSHQNWIGAQINTGINDISDDTAPPPDLLNYAPNTSMTHPLYSNQPLMHPQSSTA